MAQHYSDPSRASDPHALPDVEVFYAEEGELWQAGEEAGYCGCTEEEPNEAGWYYWFCFPGCMPDGERAMGPFATEEDAVEDARGDDGSPAGQP